MRRSSLLFLLFSLFSFFPAAEAATAFEAGNLFLVVYNEDDNEIGIDLGSLDRDWTTTEALAPAGTVSLDKFEAINDWSLVNGGCFGYPSLYQLWFGTSKSTSPVISKASILSFESSSRSVQTKYYNAQDGLQVVVIEAGIRNSYVQVMNSNANAPGYYGGLNTSRADGNGEINLAPLLDASASVQLYLYHFDVFDLDRGPVSTTDYTAVISIKGDGSVWLNLPIENRAPTIDSFTISSAAVTSGETLRLTADAGDPDDDPLTYTWSTSYSGLTGFPVITAEDRYAFDAPQVTQPTDITFTLVVSDGSHEVVADNEVTVSVTADGSENSPPTEVSAVAVPSSTTEGGRVTLTGSARDPDGDPLTYEWSTTDNVTGFPKSGAQVTFDAPAVDAATEFTFTLSVSDGTADPVTDTVTLTINDSGGANSPPTINNTAASPNPAVEGTTVTLTGSADDPDGDTLTYEWSTTDNVTGFPKTGEQVTFDAPAVDAATEFTFTLSVSDGTADPVTDTVTLTINDSGGANSPPTINNTAASPNPAVEGTTVTLTGSADDPDGDTLTYEWSTTDNVTGFPKTGEQVTFEAPAVDAATEFTFTLSVSDGTHDSVTATVTVTVNSNDSGPVANAGGYQKVTPGAIVTLNGSGSSGQIVSYLWEQTSGESVGTITNADKDVAEFTAPAAETSLTFKLTVADNEDKTDSHSCTIDVANDYITPVANAGPDQPIVWENEEVTLDGSASVTNDATIFQWRWLSGPVEVELTGDTSLVASFTAPVLADATGTFVFQLLLTEPDTTDESLDTVSITIYKNLPPNAPSMALTPVNDDGVWESKDLTPTLAVNNAEDPEGDALTYDFQLYDTNTAEPENLISGAQVPEGDTITTWKTRLLEENTLYYFRARAGHELDKDSRLTGTWMELATIFVNSEEEKPGAPTISSPTTGTSVATAMPMLQVTNTTDPDLDPLTYEFRIYLEPTDPVYSPYLEKSGVLEGTEGSTQWTVDSPLDENQSYWWRVRAIDDTGLAGEWTEPAVFMVNGANDAPNPPVITYPLDESEIDTSDPAFEIEDGLDPEGDPVVFYVEVDTVNTFDSADLIQSEAIEATSAVTTWTVPLSLDENTTYYYRAKTSDGDAESAWLSGSFLVNQDNEPPTAPVNQSPEDREVVTTLSPTLITAAATDPDQDAVTYAFELFLAGNLTEPIDAVADSTQPTWVVPGADLTNGKKYYWHVRAVDEHGEPGEWSAFTHFSTGANYYQPSTPEQVNPFNAGMVNTRTPTLGVVTGDDGDGNPIWIEFELYRDRDLSDFVSFGMVPMGITATSWQIDVTLEDLTQYFWRARATDGEKYSAWTTVAGFSVDVSGDSTPQIRVWQVANYDPTVPWYTVVEVDNADSNIYGTKVILPPGALSTHETIYIGEAKGVPSLGAELIPLGKVVEFGPSGTVFNVPVTIKIPYTDEELEKAGGISPEDLRVYTYNETDQHWETIPVIEVDHQEQVLISEVDHFSLYSTAADTGNGNDSNSGVTSGGGGGCFIGSAGSSFLAGVFGRAMAAMLTISLIIFNGYRRK